MRNLLTASLIIFLAVCISLPVYASVVIGGISYKLDETKGTATVTYLSGEIIQIWDEDECEWYTEYNINSHSSTGKGYSGDIVIPSMVYYNGKEYIVDKILRDAFSCCPDVRTIDVPTSVKEIGSSFQDSTHNESVWFYLHYTSSEDLPNFYLPYGFTYNLFVLAGTSDLYPRYIDSCDEDYWGTFFNVIEPTFKSGNITFNVTSFANATAEVAEVDPASTGEMEIVESVSVTYRVGYCMYPTYTCTVNNILSNAFSGCTQISSVKIPGSVTEISTGTFSSCTSLTKVTFGANSLSTDHDWLNVKANSFPSSVTTLNVERDISLETKDFHSTFYGSNLTTINFSGSNIKRLGSMYGFLDCSNLTTVTYSGLTNVTRIPYSLFGNTPYYESIPYENGIKYICTFAVGYDGIESDVVMKDGTTYLSEDCFEHANSKNVKSIIFPGSLECLEQQSLFYCSGLKDVKFLPGSSPLLLGDNKYKDQNGEGIFENAPVTHLYIDRDIELMNKYHDSRPQECSPLYGIEGTLEELIYGPNVTEINAEETYMLSSRIQKLTSVTCLAPQPPSGKFYGSLRPLLTLYVPEKSLGTYQSTTYWNDYKEVLPVPMNQHPVNTTDISTLGYAIYSPAYNALTGQQLELVVNMKNENPITLWQAQLVLPKGIELANDDLGDPMITISGDRTSNTHHQISANVNEATGTIQLLCNSTGNLTFTGNDGEVATITLKLADDIEPGEYPIAFKNILLVEPDESGHKQDVVTCKISVKSYTIGDLNNDGNIDGMDLVGIANYILGIPSQNNIPEAADVNMDGNIDGIDYVTVVNCILGLSTLRKAPALKPATITLVRPNASYIRTDEVSEDINISDCTGIKDILTKGEHSQIRPPSDSRPHGDN